MFVVCFCKECTPYCHSLPPTLLPDHLFPWVLIHNPLILFVNRLLCLQGGLIVQCDEVVMGCLCRHKVLLPAMTFRHWGFRCLPITWETLHGRKSMVWDKNLVSTRENMLACAEYPENLWGKRSGVVPTKKGLGEQHRGGVATA